MRRRWYSTAFGLRNNAAQSLSSSGRHFQHLRDTDLLRRERPEIALAFAARSLAGGFEFTGREVSRR
jgi:hypothetical protein